MRGCGVEITAAGVLDAGVEGHGGGLDLARDADAVGGRLLVDVVEVEVLIGGGVLGELGRASGRPAKGSSEVMRARVMAPSTRRSMLSGEKSEDEVLAVRCPMKARRPMAREPDSLSVSTWPRRTRVENSSPS